MHRDFFLLERLILFKKITLFVFLTVSLVALMGAPSAQGQAVAERENPLVRATVTSVETSPGSNGWRYLTTTLHLHNRTKNPVVLGVEPSKINATDDQRNAYSVTLVRGIGEIAGTRVDPKFVLPAESGADVLFEMRWRGERNAIFGTKFDLTVPVRVILPLAGGQYKLDKEHLLTFTGLTSGYVAMPKESDPLPKNTVNAGPFTVQITRLTPSRTARLHAATLDAQIKNTSDKPLILAYEGTSSYGIDEQGNRYAYGTAGTHDTTVKGIGIVTSLNADPQLTLAPGESRDVQFTVFRRVGREVAGTQLTYYVALVQLEVLPSKQVRTVRQFSLTFPRMPGL